MSSERLDGPGSTALDSKDSLIHGPPHDLLEPQVSLQHSPNTRSPLLHPGTPIHDLPTGSLTPNPCHLSTDSNGPLNLSHLEPRVCINTPPSPQNETFIPSVNLHSRCATTNSFLNNKKCARQIYSRASVNNYDPCCNQTSAGDSVSPPHNNNNLGNYFCSNSAPTEEEKLYFIAKRQHAMSEHEAKMKILNMELRQKEEIFSLQKQLFLIELKLKMDFLEKNCNK